MDNYDLQVDIGKRIFLEYDQQRMIRKFGLDADGQYIYRCHIKDDDFTVEPILDPKEFEWISRAYMKL